jgi:hypothetical protein
VSVESLSKFQQAANASGTSIEGVGAAMIKLNRNLATGNAGAAEALTSLGISATDASGKLKSTDQVMLEVADKFAKMEDGASKSAAAQALFGKSGADLIPLLNGGGKAITDLSATMTGAFAKGADSLNDKLAALQGKLLALGVQIGTALMPMLNVIANLVMGLANAFAAMPGPIQAIVGGLVALTAAFVVLAPAISALISIAGVLSGLQIGATIAGWAAVAGPAITAISAAFTGFMAFLTGTILPGILAFFSGPVGWTVLAVAAVVAMVALFHEPIMGFLTWLGGVLSTAFSDLMALLQPIFVQPFIDLWNNVLRAPVTAMFDWISGYIQTSMQNALALAEFVFVTPWVNLWNNVLREPVTSMIAWLQETWQGISQFFNDVIVTPIATAWTDLTTFIPEAMNAAASAVISVFTQVGTTVKGILNSILNTVIGSVNSVINEINYLISIANDISSLVNGPQLSFLPKFSIPQFAEGGVVNGPTLAMVGEAGPEYIIPASKMAAASANYLNGARGGAVIPAFASGGYVGGSNAQVNITTGPVMQQGGQQYVTVSDLEKAVRKTANDVYSSLRTPAGRYALGTR